MQILQQIYNVAMPLIVTGLVGILIKMVTPVGDMAIKYFMEKIEASGVTKKLAQHQDELLTAKSIWNVVEEKYRLTEKVEDLLVSKADMFDKLLLEKVPYLTKEQLAELRQAIAGEFNKGKQAVLNDDSLKLQQVQLTNENAQLKDINNQLNQQVDQAKAERDALKDKLNTIQNAIAQTSQADITVQPEPVVNQPQ